jgi:hypothetical protein
MKFKLPPLQSNNCRLYTKVKNKPKFVWILTQNLCEEGSETKNLGDRYTRYKIITSSKIIIDIESNQMGSRRNCLPVRQTGLLWLLKKDDKIWFREEGYRCFEITRPDFF